MKKILVLLAAACFLLVSCQKEGGNSGVDGTTWFCYDDPDSSPFRLELNDGYASLYEGSHFYDTQTYSVKRDRIIFKENLSPFYKEGAFKNDKTRLVLHMVYESGEIQPEDWTFIRVAK